MKTIIEQIENCLNSKNAENKEFELTITDKEGNSISVITMDIQTLACFYSEILAERDEK